VQCLKAGDILLANGFTTEYTLSEQDFIKLCPVLLLQLDMKTCDQQKLNHTHVHEHDHDHDDHDECAHGHNSNQSCTENSQSALAGE
jgi:hypothetical protein